MSDPVVHSHACTARGYQQCPRVRPHPPATWPMSSSHHPVTAPCSRTWNAGVHEVLVASVGSPPMKRLLPKSAILSCPVPDTSMFSGWGYRWQRQWQFA